MPAHAPGDHTTGWLLQVAAIATLLFAAGEMVGGRYSRSLSVTADAWHNFCDAVALLLTWFCGYTSGRAPSHRRTYGYGRAGVLAAFLAALALLPVAGLIFYDAYRNAVTPTAPRIPLMLVLGGASLVTNALISGSLRHASANSCPRRVALHIAGDALAGIGIVAVAILIPLTGAPILDAVLAALIAGLIVITVSEVVLDSLNTLLEGLPRGINLDSVAKAIRRLDGVEDVHDLHIWSLSPHSHALSCHVKIAEAPLVQGAVLLAEINALMEREFEIDHVTVQLEGTACEVGECCMIPYTPAAGEHDHSRH